MWKSKKEWKVFWTIFLLAIASRWIMYYGGYRILLMIQQTADPFTTFFYNRFSNSGDSVWYIKLSEDWYESSGEHANLICFYPLYPFVMKIVNFITHNAFASGLIVSNVCFGIASYVMYCVAKLDMKSDQARSSVIAFWLYPFGVFLGGIFTEGLFVLLVILCFYFIRKKNFLAAGIVGLLAAVSRSQGIVLLVPALYEAIIYCAECIKEGKKEKKPWWKCIPVSSAFVFLIPVGTFLYLLLNYVVLGNWTAFIEYQAAEPWYNTSHWISSNLEQHFNNAIEYGGLAYIIYWVQILLYFVAIIAIFYGLYKKVRPSYMGYAGAYLFVSFLHGWLISGPRYIMGCIPLYFIYGRIENKYVKMSIMSVMSVLYFYYSLMFLEGQAIM